MSVESLKAIRKVERDCEEKINKAKVAKDSAIMDAEKDSVLKVKDAEIQAKEEADKLLSGVKERVEKEFVSMDKKFEEEKTKLADIAKKKEKKALDLILLDIL